MVKELWISIEKFLIKQFTRCWGIDELLGILGSFCVGEGVDRILPVDAFGETSTLLRVVTQMFEKYIGSERRYVWIFWYKFEVRGDTLDQGTLYS